MENLTLGSLAYLISPSKSTARWLDDASLVFSAGNGLIISDVETGLQRRICSSNTQTSENHAISETNGPFVFDCKGSCLAFAAKTSIEEIGNMDSSVHLVSSTDFSPICAPLKLPWPVADEPVEWLHLSLQEQQLVTVCSHPSHSLDIWEIPLKPDPQQLPKHLAHASLGERLSSFSPSAFPFNPKVICALGSRSLRLIRYEPGLTPLEGPGHLSSVFLHDVDLATTLFGSEVISSPPMWTPSGSILLGTSQGRVLCIKDAAPLALPGQAWGAQGSALPSAIILLSQRIEGSIVNLSLTGEHIGLVVAGDKPFLAWFDVHNLNKEPLTCPLPELVGSGSDLLAVISPNRQQWALLGGNGAISLADTAFTIPPPLSFRSAEEGKPDPPSHMINTKLLSRSLSHPVVASCPLPGSLSCLLSQEGSLMVLKLGPSAPTAPPTPSSPTLSPTLSKRSQVAALNLALTSTTTATARSLCLLHLDRNVTSMAPLSRNGKPIRQVLIGTASGSLVVVSMETSRSILAMHETEASQGQGHEEAHIDARHCFELSAFDKGPVTSLAIGPRGDCCAACCEELNLIAFFRVNSSGPEASLSLLGFSEVRAPRYLAFAPSTSIDPSSNLPLLIVAGSSILLEGPGGGRSVSGTAAQSLGELIVLQVPSESYLNRDSDAMIPQGLLTRGYLRLQSKAVAIAVTPTGSSSSSVASSSAGQQQQQQLPQHLPPEDGMFFVFVAGEDRSVRRYRLLTEAQKSSAKAYHNVASIASKSRVHGNQSRAQYDPAEAEIPPGDLQLPAAALAVVTSGSSQQHLLVASMEGTLLSYSLKEMTPQHKWGLHDYSQGGCSTLFVSVDRQNTTVLSTGGDGFVCIIDMIPASVAASRRAAAASLTSPAAFGVGRSPMGLRPQGQSSFNHSAVSSVPSLRKGGSAIGPASLLRSSFENVGSIEPPIHLIQESVAEHRKAPGWREARAQAQAAAKMADTKKFEDEVALKMAKLKARLEALYCFNSSPPAETSEEGASGAPALETRHERLDASELVLDESLRTLLRSQGDERVAATRAKLVKEMDALAIVKERMMAQFGPESELRPLLKILPLPELAFTSQLAPEEAKRVKDSVTAKMTAIAGPSFSMIPTLDAGVESFVLKKPSKLNAATAKKVSFLRKVEQEEWLERSSADLSISATIAPLEIHDGPMPTTLAADDMDDDAFDNRSTKSGVSGKSGLSAKSGYSALTTASAGDMARLDEDLLGLEVKNGRSGLLYGDYQAHTFGRKVSQALLVQQEIVVVERAFNEKFDEVKELKAKAISSIEEKLSRVAELSSKLSGSQLSPSAPTMHATQTYGLSPLEEPVMSSGRLDVSDSEVPVERWVSPEEKARREEAQRLIDEARRRADADDTKTRALKEMMAGTLVKKEVKTNVLEREPWMDAPKALMSKEQRAALLEYERRKLEQAEEEEKERRAFETERKALEVEVAEIIAEHNARLAVLKGERIAAEQEVRSLELQAIRQAADAGQIHHYTTRKAKIAAEIAKLAVLREKRTGFVQLGLKSAEAAVARYDELLTDEKLLDKAFRKEILSIATSASEDTLAARLSSIYKDRTRPISTGIKRSVAEVLGKSNTKEKAPAMSEEGKKSMKAGREESGLRSRSMSAQSSKAKLEALKSQRSTKLPSSKSFLRSASTLTINGMDLAPTTATPDDPQPAPSPYPFMSTLQAMAELEKEKEAKAIKGSERPLSIDAPSVDAMAMLSQLTAGSSTSRSLDPLEQIFLEGRLPDLLDDIDPLGLEDSTIIDLFSQTTLQTLFEPGAARAIAVKLKGEESAKQTPRNETSRPWSQDLGSKPDGIDEGMFQRLIELRDTKVELERVANEAWTIACFSLVTLSYLVRDELLSLRRLEELTLTEAWIGRKISTLANNLGVTFRLKNGQVDFPPLIFYPRGSDEEGVKLHDLESAKILRRLHVEAVNRDIDVRGKEKLSILDDLKSINKTLLFSSWENSSIEMKASHRQEELAELQCMHLTRDQQLALTDPEAAAKIDHEQGFLKLIRGSTQSFNQQVEMRKMQLDKITEQLSAVMEDGEGVAQMKQEAEASKDQASKIISGLHKQDGMKAFKSIVSNTQLRTIAKEQAAEIQALRLQVEKLKAANFPQLPIGKEDAKPLPDFRLPPLSSRPGSSRSRPATASPQTKT